MDTFNLTKYFKKQYLQEVEGFPKDKWAYLTDSEKSEFSKEIFNLISTAYSPIGGNPNYTSPSNIAGSEGDADYMVIDLDDDDDFDAVKVSKKKGANIKSVATGHDDSKPAKSAVVGITSIMLKQKGNYIESSGKLKDILIAKGVPIITDKETIERIMKGKNIEMNDDGTYRRYINGKEYTKTLMGNPI
jgi:hypothetical protein